MSKFCCERFEAAANLRREQGINIRIIKFNKEELLDQKNLYRFFVTPGYKIGDKSTPTLNIAHCPFCGQNLFLFYRSDEYVNENNSDFLYL